MGRDRTRLGALTAAVAATLAVAAAQPQEPGHVDPEINKQFEKRENIPGFIKKFEAHDREVFARRDQIVAALQIKPGQSIADVGAGSGLFTRLFAEKVGPEGKVYAVDVSKDFLKHIEAESAGRGQKQVKTVLGSQDSTNLQADSVDLVYLCDVYHHLEHHQEVLASIRRALRPGGELILVEFEREAGKSSDFVLKHVRAGKETFFKEIAAAGFVQVADGPRPDLKENYFARFRKPDPAAAARP